MQSITSKPSDLITTLFGGKAQIGVIHCPPFPGSPRYAGQSMSHIYDACMRDAEAYIEVGLDGLIVENHGDVPFLKPETSGRKRQAFCL